MQSPIKVLSTLASAITSSVLSVATITASRYEDAGLNAIIDCAISKPASARRKPKPAETPSARTLPRKFEKPHQASHATRASNTVWPT